jgi:hypothetical protein
MRKRFLPVGARPVCRLDAFLIIRVNRTWNSKSERWVNFVLGDKVRVEIFRLVERCIVSAGEVVIVKSLGVWLRIVTDVRAFVAVVALLMMFSDTDLVRIELEGWLLNESVLGSFAISRRRSVGHKCAILIRWLQLLVVRVRYISI